MAPRRCAIRAASFLGDRDVKFGEIGGAPFYISGPQYEVWKHTDLIIDVVPGRGGMFSLDNGRERRFLTRSEICARPTCRRWAREQRRRAGAVIGEIAAAAERLSQSVHQFGPAAQKRFAGNEPVFADPSRRCRRRASPPFLTRSALCSSGPGAAPFFPRGGNCPNNVALIASAVDYDKIRSIRERRV